MDHLVELLTTEKAEKLQLCAGRAPVIVLERGQHALQGPPITNEEVVRLLRSVANSRQMRELREFGAVLFVCMLRGRSPVVVQAKMKDESVEFEIS